jgi:pSer/pThr/pTyr-binding forkhead associated (FHA) protein
VSEALTASGPHLAWDSGDEIETAFIPEGLTRIGRGFVAEIQLTDPTVSRRHALIHRNGDGCVVLDDHSLNGVFVDGDPVDWRPLEDGDEIEVGRFRLHFIQTRRDE